MWLDSARRRFNFSRRCCFLRDKISVAPLYVLTRLWHFETSRLLLLSGFETVLATRMEFLSVASVIFHKNPKFDLKMIWLTNWTMAGRGKQPAIINEFESGDGDYVALCWTWITKSNYSMRWSKWWEDSDEVTAKMLFHVIICSWVGRLVRESTGVFREVTDRRLMKSSRIGWCETVGCSAD